MKKLMILAFIILLMAGCSPQETTVVMVDEDGNVIKEIEPEVIKWQIVGKFELYDEQGKIHSTGDIMVDLEKQCKYISYGHSNLSPLFGEDNKVQGCKEGADNNAK